MNKKLKKWKKNPKNMNSFDRKKHAKKWLQTILKKDIILSYSKKYGINSDISHSELLELGYKDEIAINHYEKEGIDWEYRVDGYTGEMLVVPKDTEECNLYLFYS